MRLRDLLWYSVLGTATCFATYSFFVLIWFGDILELSDELKRNNEVILEYQKDLSERLSNEIVDRIEASYMDQTRSALRGLGLRIEELQQIINQVEAQPALSLLLKNDGINNEFLVRQIRRQLNAIVQSRQLSEISILDNRGQEMLRVPRQISIPGGDPLLDTVALDNHSSDESHNRWYQELKKNCPRAITVEPSRDYADGRYLLNIAETLYLADNLAARSIERASAIIRLSIEPNLLSEISERPMPSEDASAKQVIQAIATAGKQQVIHSSSVAIVGRSLSELEIDYRIIRSDPLDSSELITVTLVQREGLPQELDSMNRLKQELDGLNRLHTETSAKLGDRFRVILYLTAVGLVLLFALGSAVIFYQKVLVFKPIEALSAMSKQIASGDLSESKHRHSSFSEIADLSSSMDYMRLQLQKQKDAVHEAHKNNVSLSRQAGMADIARNVMHNIGNIVNSINISACMIEGSKDKDIDQLKEFSEALRENGFPSEDRQAAMVDWLDQIQSRIRKNHMNLKREGKTMRQNIAHVKAVISRQLDYARLSSHEEEVEVNHLIRDVLVIHKNQFSNSKAAVEYTSSTKALNVIIDIHSLMQILLNLLSNAQHACKDRVEPRIEIELTAHEDGLEFRVRDNGIGIEPENLTSIFQHGMTTRPDGHGFGLHDSINLARQMNGNLIAKSAGLDRGSEFILSIRVDIQTTPKNATDQ